MDVLLRRIAVSDEATVGLLSVDGSVHCWTLEDQPQAQKVAGETRIPAGRYPLKPYEAGAAVWDIHKALAVAPGDD